MRAQSVMIGLLFFFLCVALLVTGYLVYGRVAERVYGVDFKMVMPCVAKADGVDYVPMPVWRIFLIQLLNIAGLGPVFGALAGCLFGPAALLWIVFGCIFAGAMHDFLAALMSADHGGENLPETVGRNLGSAARNTMRALCILLLLLVGVVFTKGPAQMLCAQVGLCPELGWCGIILGYYFLATILPVNVIIGRVYPLFGVLFIVMAVGLLVALPFHCGELLPNLDFFTNAHPKAAEGMSTWPLLFVTIACGAISGFHATQSPLMIRCLPDIRRARPVFYGAMVMEGVIALIWATIGLTLRDVLTMTKPALAVTEACTLLLGPVGAFFAVLGVVVLPISSGDTAMRCCRLMLADVFRMDQRVIWRRLALALPVFACVILISLIDFSVIWRYFGWANQALSCFTLWSISVCLRHRLHWIATIPALFMTTMCTTYLLYAADCGICLPLPLSTAVGGVVSALCLILFFIKGKERPVKEK